MPQFLQDDNDENILLLGSALGGSMNSSSSSGSGAPDKLDHMSGYHNTVPSLASLLSSPPSLLPSFNQQLIQEDEVPLPSSISSSSSNTAMGLASSTTQQQQQQIGSTVPKNREEMMTEIEQTIEKVIDCIVQGEEVRLQFTSRRTSIASNFSSNKVNNKASTTQAPPESSQSKNKKCRRLPKKRLRSDSSSSQQAIVTSDDPHQQNNQQEENEQHEKQQQGEISNEESGINNNERSSRVLTLSSGKYAKSLARYLSLLEMIYEALAYKIIVTKRDMFYRDVNLFETQSVVDTIVDNISCHYNVPRSSLNVSAASKGLVFGPISIRLKNDKILDCMSIQINNDVANDEQGTLIPPIGQVAEVRCRARLILVIEKEATFRYLVSVGFCQLFPQSCVLVTGKGYPDLSTRQFVKYFSTHFKHMPIFALMDNDPHGLDIYATYKWGARALSFDVLNLAVNEMELIGLNCQDRDQFNISAKCRIPMTQRDRSKLFSMIFTDDYMNETAGSSQMRDRGWRNATHEQLLSSQSHQSYINEIYQLLKSDYKCELQALNHTGPYGLTSYLTTKLAEYQL